VSENRTITVFVALPEGTSASWLRTAEILTWHGWPASVPLPAFPVRRGPFTGWFTRWISRHLIDASRHHGAVTRAAGGRLSRLDLDRLVFIARREASARWWTWNTHVARRTPAARTWEDFQAQHERDPQKLPLGEARTRFEAQPRVLAMFAYNSYPGVAHTLDPDNLAAFQAGEAMYVALHWHHVLTGDALITPDGQLLRPASPTPADQLRYRGAAARVIASLTPAQHLVAVQATPAP
jgi:hypothetical protein